MCKYRKDLPQLGDAVFVTDGELEHVLSLQNCMDVPQLAAFDLLRYEAGRKALYAYYVRYASLARAHGVGLVLETATSRANPDWGAILGYDAGGLARVRRTAIDLLLDVRRACETADTAIVISGAIGPRTDGYNPALRMSAYEAAHYHAPELETFAQTDADMVTARGVSYVEEAVGIALAAAGYGIPAAVSFRPGASGRLLCGDTLTEAIERIDRETQRYPAYYMIECSQLSQLPEMLSHGGAGLARVRGIRVTRRHAQFNLGEARTLASHYSRLCSWLPNLSVVGAEHDRVGPMPKQSIPRDDLRLLQPYSMEFLIRSDKERSGPALRRPADTSEDTTLAV
jgi:homocysteine S-methyltransferase